MIVVTGSRCRVGSHLAPRGRGVDLGDALNLEKGDTLIHCAVNWSSWRNSLAINLDAIEAATKAGVRRIIFTSSVWADPATNGLGPFNEGSAAKVATEAWLRAWSESGNGDAVCLRLGAYGVDRDHAWKLTDRGLDYWIDRALTAEGFHVWTATGDGPG